MRCDVFNAIKRHGKEDIGYKNLAGGKTTIQTVGEKLLDAFDMEQHFTGIGCMVNFIKGGAKLWGRCINHRVVGDAEQ